MARPLRVQFPGAVYHITSRGNARQSIYLHDGDRQRFCRLLAHVISRYAWRCHAFCLMTNHYHLLIETLQPTLVAGMRQLNGVYTQQFNHRHGRVGHVFQGRYAAILVQKETHLLELCRYVVLNPVRARMVTTPGAWPWSSYRATVGEALTASWLTTDWILSQFGRTRTLAQQQYHTFVQAGLTVPSPWKQLRGQIYLGSDAFCERVAMNLVMDEVPRIQRQPVRPPLEALFAAPGDRSTQLLRAYRDYGYRLRDMAQHLGVHYATVSRWLRAVETREALRRPSSMYDCKT